MFYFLLRCLRRQIPAPLALRMFRLMSSMSGWSPEDSFRIIVNNYENHLARVLGPAPFRNRTVLEIGVGEHNASCYEILARGASRGIGFEPFRPLNGPADRRLLERVCRAHKCEAATLQARLERVTALDLFEPESIDLIVSNSVLEHVTNLDALARRLCQILRPDGGMLHIVDYRDHFFRYPYHLLLWSRAVWERFLDPGDLPRHRMRDHFDAFARHGLHPTVLWSSEIPEEFAKVKRHIHTEFSRYSEPDLAVATAVLYAVKQPVAAAAPCAA